MMGDLLPPDIVFVIATEAMQTQPLGDEEESCIAHAVDKRKREFRGGRHAAKVALNRLGYDQGAVLVRDEQSGRPNWPVGYVGSITHTAGFCAAATARSSAYQAIGIDAEPRTALKPKLLPRICTDREQRWIAQQPDDWQKPYWGKTLFCIKETLYKVFNPINQVFLGFHEAEVYLSPQDGTFSADIFQVKNGIRCRYDGRFSMDDNFIYAVTLVTRE